jgi:regulator of protease activity HflC (stomatin/prohibitin superfamily)
MKNWRILILMILIAVVMGTTACSKVPAGNVGIKVYLLGGNKGVDTEELGVGRHWIGINEDLYIFPTFTQNYVWTKDPKEGSKNDESLTFQTIEGMSVNADVGISYHIDPVKVSLIFQKYRKGIDEITDIFLRNMVRDAFVQVASTRAVEDIYGAKKAEIVSQVESMVKNQVRGIGIEIERIYLIGNMRLPDQVVKALNEKIQATQRAQQRENEIREADAEAQKKIAQAKGIAESIKLQAEAQAEANIKLAKSITPELVQYKAIEKWDGILPKLTGSNAIPMIDLK